MFRKFLVVAVTAAALGGGVPSAEAGASSARSATDGPACQTQQNEYVFAVSCSPGFVYSAVAECVNVKTFVHGPEVQNGAWSFADCRSVGSTLAFGWVDWYPA